MHLPDFATMKFWKPKKPNLDEAELPRAGRALILSSAAAIGGFLLWASLAELDQITRATGQVIASSRNQVIQSQEGGTIAEIYVKEGDRVKRDQLLFRFDKTKTEAAYQESAAKAAAQQAEFARLNAEVFGGTPNFPPELKKYPEFRTNQLILFNKRQTALNEEISAMQQSLALANSELSMNLPLLKAGDVSKADILRLQRQVAEIQSNITNRRNKYLQDTQAELAKVQQDLAGVLQIVIQRKEQLDNIDVKAPMDGIVRNIRITTRGGVARPSEEIMQLVPVDDDLLIEAKVKSSDIAFVKTSLPATIKLDAYDYTIYGTLSGDVVYISADTISEENKQNEPPYYRVQVKAKAHDLKSRGNETIRIQPGMTATVEIKTGSNTVLRYLTKPITKTISESLGER
jgi:adhesin transport system membrane fusion protein